MSDRHEACVCGHPKQPKAKHPEYTSEGRTLMQRLADIRARRSELARELGALIAEEDRLRAEMTASHHTPES
jgi:hypothetical protein